MSKKKESPKKYEKASDDLRKLFESRSEEVEKSGEAIKKLSDKVNELSDKANEPIQYYPIESVCVGDGFEQPIFNPKSKCTAKCDTKCCCKDEIKMLRKEISDLRRSYNGYKGAMKQADRERDAKVRELANDISIHDNCIINLHGRLEELEEKDTNSLFRKRYLIWGVVICIVVVVLLALISAYFK